MECFSWHVYDMGYFREHDKKVCCLGLTALLQLPVEQLPAEALLRVFKATLDLLVAYKDQVAGKSITIISSFLYYFSMQSEHICNFLRDGHIFF